MEVLIMLNELNSYELACEFVELNSLSLYSDL